MQDEQPDHPSDENRAVSASKIDVPTPVADAMPAQDPVVSSDTPPTEAVVPADGGSRKRRWKIPLALALLVAALGVSGWYLYGSQKDSTIKTSASKDIPLLKIGLHQTDYGKLYPSISLSENSFIVNAQLFEGLVRYEDKSKLVPALANNWTNPDDSTWIFTIKDGIKFHDGNMLTAKDVKYSLDTIINMKDSDFNQTFADTIKSVEVVGSNKVKITTTVPDPVLLNKLNFLYIIDSNAPKGSEPSMAGTGPYEIKPGTKPTSTHVQMVAFNGYHGGRPKTQALDFGNGDTTTALLKGLKDHKFDIVGPNLQINAPPTGTTPFVVTEPDVAFIGFNTVKAGPLQNKLLREAVRYAVNPLAIGKAAGSEVTPLSQLIPESIPGYNPSIPTYKQNVAKAKQLLAQAGYPNGVTISYSTAADPKKAEEIAKELKDVGITATIDHRTDFDKFIDDFSSGKVEMYDVQYSSDTLDGLDIYTSNLSTANYDNPQLNTLLDQAATATVPSKRLKLLQDVAVIVNQDIPVVPLSTQDDLYIMDKDYAITQDMPSSLVSVYFYKVHLK
jgi:peptide/nickel transport system substrate-binding protein